MIATISASRLSIPAPRVDWNAVLNDPRTLAGLLRKREVLGYGAFGVVFEVSGAAVKIGCIGEREAVIQQWVHKHHRRALPVWAFGSDIFLPKVVTREVCPRHGYLSELWLPSSVMCHCNGPMSVLVMPIAERANQRGVDGDGDRIGNQIYQAVVEKFGVCLDVHKGNFLEFNGRLMVCDFGDTNDKVVDYW